MLLPTPDHSLVHLDGSEGEGGGQILRTALTLSVLTARPFKLENIRAKRPKPGLRAQHLECVNAAATLAHAQVTGAELHSRTLTFTPIREVAAAAHNFEINTAGSISLLLQTVLLALALAEGKANSRATATGGTHVGMAPTFHYLDRHFRPMIARMGFALDLTLDKAGFYPKGGGRVVAHIERVDPSHLAPIVMTGARRENTTSTAMLALATFTGGEIPDHVAEREVERISERIKHEAGLKLPRPEHDRANPAPRNPGNIAFARATWTADDGEAAPVAVCCYDALAERGKRAEAVADEVADPLVAFAQHPRATVDGHLADQLMLPATIVAALRPELPASRYTSFLVTNHLLTNALTIARFVPSVTITIDKSTCDVTIAPA